MYRRLDCRCAREQGVVADVQRRRDGDDFDQNGKVRQRHAPQGAAVSNCTHALSHRRMFPSLSMRVSGLDPDARYEMSIEMEALDSKRYRYCYETCRWLDSHDEDGSGNNGKERPPSPDLGVGRRLYVHPDSPSTGAEWMRQAVSFAKMKLTNNQTDDKGHVRRNAGAGARVQVYRIFLSLSDRSSVDAQISAAPECRLFTHRPSEKLHVRRNDVYRCDRLSESESE